MSQSVVSPPNFNSSRSEQFFSWRLLWILRTTCSDFHYWELKARFSNFLFWWYMARKGCKSSYLWRWIQIMFIFQIWKTEIIKIVTDYLRWEVKGTLAGGLAPAILLCEPMGGFLEPDTLGTTAVAGHPIWEVATTSLPGAFQRSTATWSPATAGQHPCIPAARTQ